MSFSETVKNEILTNSHKKCCLSSLRLGEIITESKDVYISDIKAKTKDNCCKKAFLKGVFLGSGCIVNPNTDYHFEVTVKLKSYAEYIVSLLEEFIVFPKVIKRNKNTYVVYIKDSEQISTFLAVIGANKAIMEYENVRVEKSIKNDINRTVNCETANLSKTIETSYKQIKAIDELMKNKVFDKLNSSLKELCILRKENPTASLDELSSMSSEKISKSGIYHRLKKIQKLAESL